MPRINVRVPGGQPLFDLTSYGRGSLGRRDRLSPAELALIARTVHRSPEVIVRVVTRGSTGIAAVANHVGYISRQGALAVETDDGERRRAPELADELIEQWNLDLEEHRRQRQVTASAGRKPPKLVHKLMLSMPAGTCADGVARAARHFLRGEFATRHRYAFVLHTDVPHPHVHVLVKAVSELGTRLKIDKRTLYGWREQFATQLRAEGIEANATPRVVRGQSRASMRSPLFRAARRGASHRINRGEQAVLLELSRGGIRVEPGKARLLSTRAKVEAGWLALSRVLQAQGHVTLAGEVERFVQRMPPAWTDKERMAHDLLHRAHAMRSPREPPTR